MSVLNNSNAIESGGYNIDRSLRFRSSASAYLSRTNSNSPTNSTKGTLSVWVKRGSLNTGTSQYIVETGTGTSNDSHFTLFFDTNNNINSGQYSETPFTNTSIVFRDPSAWYHVFIAYDSTQATAANRFKLYINNQLLTSSTTISLNNQWAMLQSGQLLNIGRHDAVGRYFDGYLAEFNLIDGQALTPSSFGQTDAVTGVWTPKKYTGTYGTNGFYLNFKNNTSATTLAYDKSGNGNNWTANNISTTSGASYDSMTDVPTLTSATAANYCTLNPLNANSGAISDGNLKQLYASASYQTAIGTLSMSTGKWYCEITCTAIGGTGDGVIGIAASQPVSTFTGNTATSYGWYSKGSTYNNGTSTAYNSGAQWTTNDVVGISFDSSTGTLVFYKNGVSQGTAYSGIPAGDYFVAVSSYSSTTFAANFGQRPFSYTPPTGFKALNTFNLPDPVIKKPNQYMDATTYTGNGSTQTITNAGGFQPDLVWLKDRTTSYNHALNDSVRGAGKTLESNTTNSEFSYGAYFTSLNSNGFSLAGGIGQFNLNNDAYVAWQWKKGATPGFDIVTFTGDGSGPKNIAHSLGVAPKMIIIKSRNNVSGWNSYHASLGNTQQINLQSTAAASSSIDWWNNTSPTSSQFTIGANLNISGWTFVAYLFAEISGFSKFGIYTGNGSTDGPNITCGFQPRFIMFKRTDSGADWHMYDTARDTYNVVEKELNPNTSIAETTAGGPRFDYTANGFKVRTTGAALNASGGTYIYAAFAAYPFKYSNAR